VRWTSAFILAPASLIVATLQIGPVAASRYQPLDARRVAYTDAATDHYLCRLGWWQTLRYGHVRPQWGIRCR
jgi:hypothetical protein